MRGTGCITRARTGAPQHSLSCNESCGASQSACLGLPLWSHLAFHPQLLLGPNMDQAGGCSLLFICVLTSLSQPWVEYLSFSFLHPFFTHPSRAKTSPLPPWQMAHMSFGFRALGVWIPPLLFTGCRTWRSSLTLSVPVKCDDTTSLHAAALVPIPSWSKSSSLLVPPN